MKITEAQLDEYIALYKKEYGVNLERVHALSQLHKLINLTLYMTLPLATVKKVQELMDEKVEDLYSV
jgi:hypothetical protein